MPQMAPMMWCVLFFYFIMLMLILMELVFFESAYKNSIIKNKNCVAKFNWKW
uniref:ATP synthase complex subunit 8 n=1 Tax=Hyalella sp. 2015-x TaxID=2742071 RepID=A0A7T8ZSP9_9CRUS|nr:ATP synthase F0 subunit 8 [Hyalella sp. 2015-x]